jgi:hypothetical protein
MLVLDSTVCCSTLCHVLILGDEYGGVKFIYGLWLSCFAILCFWYHDNNKWMKQRWVTQP